MEFKQKSRNLQAACPYKVRGLMNRQGVSTWYTGSKYVLLLVLAYVGGGGGEGCGRGRERVNMRHESI